MTSIHHNDGDILLVESGIFLGYSLAMIDIAITCPDKFYSDYVPWLSLRS